MVPQVIQNFVSLIVPIASTSLVIMNMMNILPLTLLESLLAFKGFNGGESLCGEEVKQGKEMGLH